MPKAKLTQNRLFAVICLVLAVMTLAVYWPLTSHPFINFDDDDYIIGNKHVTGGLTWTNAAWAFTSGEAANWHPVTWISHMADCSLFGLNAGGHHLTNLLLHIANTLLLFWLLNRMTGATWRSAFVAAFFAWHPLHVESVAWASERKDTLSTFFFLLTLMAYARYAQGQGTADTRQSGGGKNPRSLFLAPGARFYFAALFFFVLGLMSKPMVVTLPFVLLLLDFWPLRRITGFKLQPAILVRPVVEKIPFFALSLAGSVVTFLVQQSGGAMSGTDWGLRLENIVLAYVRYLSKLCWPQDLAIVYSFPHQWPAWLAAGAALLLLTWTALTLYRARENPYLPIGWFWFLGTLVPAIGIVTVGAQSIADRYTYIPSIGFFIVVVWGVCDLAQRWPAKRKFAPLAGAVALAGCLAMTRIQIGFWQDSEKLFLHAIEVTTDNYVAENCLGKTYERMGRNDRALVLYANAVVLEPRYPLAQLNLALCLIGFGKTDEALEHLRIAASLQPHNPDIQYDLAVCLSQQGNVADAASRFRSALADRPDFPEAKVALHAILAAHPELKTSEPLDTAK